MIEEKEKKIITDIRELDSREKNIINKLKLLNPYPEIVFTEPTKKEFEKMRKVMKENGLVPDRFFGSWGRELWNNCIYILIDILKHDIDEKSCDQNKKKEEKN